ncbi:MAG: hypothetical protein GX771_09540 [Halomonadaceae bacterium]|nr:hypothetical protein [Halomonadaceae bacterium]
MNFPSLKNDAWRTERPYIITLNDGDRLPAYPILGKIEESELHFGAACTERMWLVNDSFIESELIDTHYNARTIDPARVAQWEAVHPID